MVSGPVENHEEHPEAGDPPPEAGRRSGAPPGFPVPLAHAIGEWAAQQDARHLLPGWLAEAGRSAREAGRAVVGGPDAPVAAIHDAPAPARDPGAVRDGTCPRCGTARLIPDQIVCEACGISAAVRRPGPHGAPAASHGPAPGTRPGEAHSPGRPGRSGDRAGTTERTGRAGACANCHPAPPGPGGSLCPPCRAATVNQQRRPGRSGEHDDESGEDGAVAVRQAARLYLDHGLLPVPAWGVRPGGQCCCHRAAGCQRPGKHPRSVHVGPGEHDYSWKPLACATREEIEQRFADGGDFAAGNLMLAIPAGMLVIDQDDDDGGHQAIAALAEQLGELPGTLSHRTPHGIHRIYRTPPGWTPRAWVGKDARNPLPAGIDLRVPGQVLMAPPSRVPAAGSLAGYGPAVGGEVAELPAAYVSAWTPPKEPARAPRPAAPIPPGKADAAAAYVHARIAGIVEDLAGREPGGRNTAIYTAALKVGSTLGAARSTPGAENAAAAWSDEAAADALLAAAGRNGYVAGHSGAAARSAIRSGLRNGLRSPRPLPDFASRPASHVRDRGRAPERAGPDASAPARGSGSSREQSAGGERWAWLGRLSLAGRDIEPGRAGRGCFRHAGRRSQNAPGRRVQAGQPGTPVTRRTRGLPAPAVAGWPHRDTARHCRRAGRRRISAGQSRPDARQVRPQTQRRRLRHHPKRAAAPRFTTAIMPRLALSRGIVAWPCPGGAC